MNLKPKTLIVSATILEIKPLLNDSRLKIINNKEKRIIAEFNHMPLDFIITGIGMVACTHELSKILYHGSYDFVINMGIAGSFVNNIEMGEIVIVNKDCFPEIGVDTEKGIIPLFFEENNQKKQLLFDVENINPIPLVSLSKFKSVKGITVNSVTGTFDKAAKIKKTFHADIETMEGAAFLYVCNEFKQSCTQIRCISNVVGETNKDKWHIESAVTKLNEALADILNEISC